MRSRQGRTPTSTCAAFLWSASLSSRVYRRSAERPNVVGEVYGPGRGRQSRDTPTEQVLDQSRRHGLTQHYGVLSEREGGFVKFVDTDLNGMPFSVQTLEIDADTYRGWP